MKDIYKKMYESGGKLSLSSTPRIRIMAEIIDRLHLKNSNILDIGCYDGTFLSLVKNRNNNFFGVEASDYGVKKCQEKGIDIKQLFFDEKTNFPYPNGFFDLIVAGEIIEHIYDTDFFLEEVTRMLKPGGKFLISTPNIASFGRRLMLFFGISPIIELSPNEPDSSGHIRYFTFKTLKDILKKHSLGVVAKRSDVINFSKDGKIKLRCFSGILMEISQSIIYLCEKH